MPLLNYYSQTKMTKGEKFGVKTAILHLAPFDLSGKNVCPKASIHKKEQAAISLIAMADALDRNPEWMEGC